MNNLSKLSRTETLALDKQILVGIQTDLQTTSTISLGGTSYTPTSLAAFIQSRIDAANALAAAKASWQNAARSYDAINAEGIVVVRDLRYLVIATFGETSPKLADFGFTAPKQATQTPDEKQAIARKRLATFRARRAAAQRKAKAAARSTASRKS
jgi:hypothetical protein